MVTEPPEKLRPTPVRVVAVAAMVGAVVTYVFFATLENLSQSAPRVPPIAWISMAGIAIATGALAWVTQQQVQKRREPIEPGRGVALLVLGKTALLAGAVFAGGYLTVLLLYLPRIAAPIPAERVLNGGIAAGAAVVLAVAGWLLERACITPDSDDSGESGDDIP